MPRHPLTPGAAMATDKRCIMNRERRSMSGMNEARPAGPDAVWRCRDRELRLDARPLIMGIINVTPDSFSDGGETTDAGSAAARAWAMIEQGADIIDIGGESTRPGAQPVDAAEQRRRTIPVIRRLCEAGEIALSIDTRSAEVARAALDAGVHIVNDVSALGGDAAMLPLIRDRDAGVVLMHMRGTPATMQDAPAYQDVVTEVGDYLAQRARVATDAGVDATRIVIDPGIGFGKTLAHNVALLASVDRLAAGTWPVLLGFSRKRFLTGIVGDRDPKDRLAAGLAVVALAVWQGVSVIRTHDVAATRDAIEVACALRRERKD